MLKLAEKISGADVIIERLRQPKSFRSAWSEAEALSQLVSIGFKVVIAPRARVGHLTKRPDFRVEANGNWIYVEVSQPESSEAQRHIMEKLNSIHAAIFDIMPEGTRIEVYFYREPTDVESHTIINTVKALLHDGETQYQIEGFVQVFVNAANVERLSTFEDSMRERRPVLVLAAGQAPASKSVTLKIGYSDERAQQILNRERSHFPKNSRNLLVLDLSLVPGGIKAWETLISGRLQPKLNRRIGAVLLTRSNLNLQGGIRHEKKLIVHPAPYMPIPLDVLSRIKG